MPDAGPLISLAVSGSLDLLLHFKRDVQIVITDIVEYEITNKIGKKDADDIRRFLTRNENRIQIEQTTIGKLWRSSIKNGEEIDGSDLGEISIISYIKSLHEPNIPTLIIFEDSYFVQNKVVQTLPSNVRVISTMAFLAGLEKCGAIPSAKDVIKNIKGSGRNVSDIEIDQRSKNGNDE
jgi:predicted nucleic acid-binding protein